MAKELGVGRAGNGEGKEGGEGEEDTGGFAPEETPTTGGEEAGGTSRRVVLVKPSWSRSVLLPEVEKNRISGFDARRFRDGDDILFLFS